MLRSLYRWCLSLARSRYGLWVLAGLSFLESSIFPIPPDALMIPMVIAAPNRAFLIATVAMLSSVAGALLGYYIGYGLLETIGLPILDFYGKAESFEAFKAQYNEYGALAVLFAGVTPFPFKVITIASGATQLSLPIFIASSLVARSLRFFILCALLWKFGPSIQTFIEKRLGIVFTVATLILFGGFALVKFL